MFLIVLYHSTGPRLFIRDAALQPVYYGIALPEFLRFRIGEWRQEKARSFAGGSADLKEHGEDAQPGVPRSRLALY